MAIEIIHAPGDPFANSFASREEINTILAARMPLDPAWETTGDASAQRIIMATRIIVAHFSGRKVLVRPKSGEPYYLIGREWTGEIADDIQSLPWPRIGMFDRFGRAIDPGEIPYDLKVAQAELAGQLGSGDRTLDNDIIAQGIKAIKASSVELEFRDDMDFSSSSASVIPQSVFDLLVPSWYTEERVETVGTGKRARLWNL